MLFIDLKDWFENLIKNRQSVAKFMGCHLLPPTLQKKYFI